MGYVLREREDQVEPSSSLPTEIKHYMSAYVPTDVLTRLFLRYHSGWVSSHGRCDLVKSPYILGFKTEVEPAPRVGTEFDAYAFGRQVINIYFTFFFQYW